MSSIEGLRASRRLILSTLFRACRTTQVANREVAQSLIPYIATFAKFFIPAQLIGAGEVGKHGVTFGTMKITE
jgi:hypothetical protein